MGGVDGRGRIRIHYVSMMGKTKKSSDPDSTVSIGYECVNVMYNLPTVISIEYQYDKRMQRRQRRNSCRDTEFTLFNLNRFCLPDCPFLLYAVPCLGKSECCRSPSPPQCTIPNEIPIVLSNDVNPMTN